MGLGQSPNHSEANGLVVRFLKGLNPSNKLFDGCSVIPGTQIAQAQIGVDDGHRLYGPVRLKLNFCGHKFDVPMRFEHHGTPQVGHHADKKNETRHWFRVGSINERDW